MESVSKAGSDEKGAGMKARRDPREGHGREAEKQGALPSVTKPQQVGERDSGSQCAWWLFPYRLAAFLFQHLNFTIRVSPAGGRLFVRYG